MIFWFKVFIGYTVILLIWDIFIWMSKNRWEQAVNKRVEVVLSAPREKRDKFLKSNYSFIKKLKFILWLEPLCLIMFIILIPSLTKETKEIIVYLIIILLLGYPTSIYQYLFRKTIITELESKMATNNL
jgi:hypothetical protein